MGRRDDDDRSEKDDPWGNRLPRSQWDDRRISTSQTPAPKELDFTPSRKDLDIMNSGKLGTVVIIPDKGLAGRLEDLHDQVIDGKILLSPKLVDVFTTVYGNSPKESRNYSITFVTQSEVRDGYLRKALDSRLDDSEE
jgi:hypothetical protein